MVVQASISQLDDVVELFDLYRIFYKKESDKVGAKAFLTDRLLNKESIVFIYYDENEPVGFTQLYPKYSSARMVRNWILNDLYVKPSHRCRGIAESLIARALVFGKEQYAAFVQLETQIDNFTAQRVYEKMGFELQGPDEEFILYKKYL